MDCSNYFGEGKLFYYWKARVGLYMLLQALGIKPGDEIILPGYTCVVVPNAILYAGGTPVYADIDPRTYNATCKTIEPLVTPRTRVIIAQNTFGLSPDIDPILSLARARNIFVVEDCTQGLGGSYKGRPAGLSAEAAFFSTQWSKPISAGLGGILWLRDLDVATKVSTLNEKLSHPGIGEDLILGLQRLLRPLADRPILHYMLVQFYRFLTQKLGVTGSGGRNELTVIEMPKNYLKLMGKSQKKAVERGFEGLNTIIEYRQQNSEWYDQYFHSRGFSTPYRPDYAEHSMLRYTIRVPNKLELLDKARRLHIPIGDWFASPLHPVQGDLTQWMYTVGHCLEAEKACRETINLSTDRPLSLNQMRELFP